MLPREGEKNLPERFPSGFPSGLRGNLSRRGTKEEMLAEAVDEKREKTEELDSQSRDNKEAWREMKIEE